MQNLSFSNYSFKIKKSEQNVTVIFDVVRKKFVKLTPEEWVRQHVVHFLNELKYPLSLMAVEKEIKLFKTKKRFDILVHNSQGTPEMLVECKAPDVKINQAVFDQICRYNVSLQVPLLFITNGLSHYCIKFEKEEPIFLDSVPTYIPKSVNT